MQLLQYTIELHGINTGLNHWWWFSVWGKILQLSCHTYTIETKAELEFFLLFYLHFNYCFILVMCNSFDFSNSVILNGTISGPILFWFCVCFWLWVCMFVVFLFLFLFCLFFARLYEYVLRYFVTCLFV